MPSPSQMHTFLAVIETGSVRAAADRLVVSQPAVSSVLGALQRELGVRLFERAGRGLRPTPAGHAFALDARRIGALLG
ncbi:MAG: LysR family transcriptional regulator, partial [Vulcanimicrobiaceae bacterium]